MVNFVLEFNFATNFIVVIVPMMLESETNLATNLRLELATLLNVLSRHLP